MNDANVYPYFEASKEAFEAMCVGMTYAGKRQFANMLAHHCMPMRRDVNGWILSRIDLGMEGQFWHVGNDGKLTYNYKPDREKFCDSWRKNMPVATAPAAKGNG
jgi:hypothetical protein